MSNENSNTTTKKLSIVEQLREKGCQVSVRHERTFVHNFVQTHGLPVTGALQMTRREFSTSGQETNPDFVLDNRGGNTIVSVITPGGETLTGNSKCSFSEQFNRKRGLSIAMGRALKGVRI